jgi:hypothetical protein
MWRAPVAAALVLMLTAARAETVFTATNGREGKDASKPEFGDWVCRSPGGYAVHLMDEGNMVGIALRLPSRYDWSAFQISSGGTTTPPKRCSRARHSIPLA